MKIFKYSIIFAIAGIIHYFVVATLLATKMARAVNSFEAASGPSTPTLFGKVAEIALAILLLPGTVLENMKICPSSLSGPISIFFYASIVTFLFFLIFERGKAEQA